MIEYEVKSSNIKSIGYDPESKRLRVTFASGAAYDYEDVPADLVCNFMFAKSAGKFFAGSVKDKYKGIKQI